MSNEVEMNTEYINTNKNALQRVIDFVDAFRCEFQVGNEGYIKLPQVIGGFIIQWGEVSFMHTGDRRDNYYDRQYVIPFEQHVFYINSRCTTNAWVCTTCTDATLSAFKLWVVNIAERNLANMEFRFNWFAIGK